MVKNESSGPEILGRSVVPGVAGTVVMTVFQKFAEMPLTGRPDSYAPAELVTAVSHELPVKLMVFDNGRLGMVKLEMEQVGLPEFGTVLHNPDFAEVARAVGMSARRVERPAEVESAVQWAMAEPGPVLVDVVTSADEVAVPPKPTLKQGWGFAIAKSGSFWSARTEPVRRLGRTS